MSAKQWMTSLALAALAGLGCDPGADSTAKLPPESKSPAPQPVQVDNAAQAKFDSKPAEDETAATAPASTFLWLDEKGTRKRYDFPPARLRLKHVPGGVLATLYTDDPPEAARRDYHGNSYLFEMALTDVQRPADLDGAQWIHEPIGSAAEKHDDPSLSGIFMDGSRRRLKPDQAIVAFQGVNPLIVTIEGSFRQSGNRNDAPQTVMVSGQLTVTVEEDGK